MIFFPGDIIDTSKNIIADIKDSYLLLDFSVPTSAMIDDLFDPADGSGDITDTPKDTIGNIHGSDPFFYFSVPTSAIIDNLFEPSNDSDNEKELIIAEPAISDDVISIPDTYQVNIDSGPPQRKKIVATYMKGAVKAAERIKKKYTKQKKNRAAK